MKLILVTFALIIKLNAFCSVFYEESSSEIAFKTIDSSVWGVYRTELIPNEIIEFAFPSHPEIVQNGSNITLKAIDRCGMTHSISTMALTEENVVSMGYKMFHQIDYESDKHILYTGPIRDNPMSYEPTPEERRNSINKNTGYIVAWTDEHGRMTRLTLFKGKEMVYVLESQITHEDYLFYIGCDIQRMVHRDWEKCNDYAKGFSIDSWKS